MYAAPPLEATVVRLGPIVPLAEVPSIAWQATQPNVRSVVNAGSSLPAPPLLDGVAVGSSVTPGATSQSAFTNVPSSTTRQSPVGSSAPQAATMLNTTMHRTKSIF